MKQKNNLIFKVLYIFSYILLISCTDDAIDLRIPHPNDITFNELKLERFTFEIPDAPFQVGDVNSGIITVNTVNNANGTYSGFALSNKNWRSYPWSLSPDFAPSVGLSVTETQVAIDSTIFSVFTNQPNSTGNFLVGCVKNNDAYITMDNPTIVEHVLVANTSYNYLLCTYGSIYSETLDTDTQSFLITGTPVRNIKNPNPSTSKYGRFALPGPNNTSLIRLSGHEILEKRKAGTKAADVARNADESPSQVIADSIAAYNALSTGYVKLIIEGFKGGTATGTVDYYLAGRPNTNTSNPLYDKIIDDWFKVDLSALGEVDKILFRMTSSYLDTTGQMLTPPYFCLDGIRLKK